MKTCSELRHDPIEGQVTLAAALSIDSMELMAVTASRNENATAWTEIARAISSAATSLAGAPQKPTNICAPGARRRIRLTRKRARAGELVLISDRHTTEAFLKSGKYAVSADSASAGRGAPMSKWRSKRSTFTSNKAAASSSSLRPATQTTSDKLSGFGPVACSGAAAESSSSNRFSTIEAIAPWNVVRSSNGSTPRLLSVCALAKAGIATSSKNSVNELFFANSSACSVASSGSFARMRW